MNSSSAAAEKIIPFDPERARKAEELIGSPFQVGFACSDTLDLVKSEEFRQFFRVMNAERAKEGRERASRGYGDESYPIEPERLIEGHIRGKVLAFWKNLKVEGRVRPIAEVNALVERLAQELEEKEKLDLEHRLLADLHNALGEITKDQAGA